MRKGDFIPEKCQCSSLTSTPTNSPWQGYAVRLTSVGSQLTGMVESFDEDGHMAAALCRASGFRFGHCFEFLHLYVIFFPKHFILLQRLLLFSSFPRDAIGVDLLVAGSQGRL